MRSLYIIVFFGLLSANVFCNVTVDLVTLHKLLQGFEDLKRQINGMEAQLTNLQISFDQKMSSLSNGCSVRDITNAITSQKFEMANQQIIELADNKKISNIVHKVYAGSPANIDIILDFSKELTNNDAKFRVFAALRHEMHLNDHTQPLKYLALVDNTERQLIKKSKVSVIIKAKAQGLIDGIIPEIKAATVGMIKNAMILDQYQVSTEALILADAVFSFRSDLFNEVMEEVVGRMIELIAPGMILENISHHKHIPQVVAGLKSVFKRRNSTYINGNTTTLNIAEHLQRLKLRKDYEAADLNSKNAVEEIIAQLPACAKSLYFYKNICFFNKGNREYMFAATSKNTNNRRNVFTLPTEVGTLGVMWSVEMSGEHYTFKNRDYDNEYLVPEDKRYGRNLSHLLTSLPDEKEGVEKSWFVELDGDYCYVKSTHNHDYLCVPNMKYHIHNNFVFISPGIREFPREYYQWELRNCGEEGEILN